MSLISVIYLYYSCSLRSHRTGNIILRQKFPYFEHFFLISSDFYESNKAFFLRFSLNSRLIIQINLLMLTEMIKIISFVLSGLTKKFFFYLEVKFFYFFSFGKSKHDQIWSYLTDLFIHMIIMQSYGLYKPFVSRVHSVCYHFVIDYHKFLGKFFLV